jgi:hypothetical protein
MLSRRCPISFRRLLRFNLIYLIMNNSSHTLTEAEQKQFLESDSRVCPCCQAKDDFEGQEVVITGGLAIQELSCNVCELTLEACYTLTHLNQ